MKTQFLIILVFIFSNSHAQLIHNFSQRARNTHYGSPEGLAVGSDGTVFLSFDDGGLRAYNYDGDSLINTTLLDDSIHARDIAISPDGTIFQIGNEFLRAFNYNGSSFNKTAHLDLGIEPYAFTVGPDSMIYVSYRDGLRAYFYDGSSFTNTAQLGTGDGVEIWAMAVGEDGTIYCAAPGAGGLRAYHYGDDSISLIDKRWDGGNGEDVAVGPDGTIFLANREDGIRAYRFDGESFETTAHAPTEWYVNKVAVDPDGTVFTIGDKVLRAYFYTDSSFILTAYTDIATSDRSNLAIGPDGTLFLARGPEMLETYSYFGDTLVNTATYRSGYAADVDIGPDGTVFLVNMGDGLRAYSYDGNNLISEADIDFQVYVTCCMGGCGAHDVRTAVGSDGTVFLANWADGLKAYNYNGSAFSTTAHSSIEGVFASDIALGPDGTIFLANTGFSSCIYRDGIDDDGLRAFTFNGNSITNTAHIDDEGWAIRLAVSPDGIVFLASNDSLMRAYRYDGSSFTYIMHIGIGTYPQDVAVGLDGTVYLACGENGLRAYKFDGESFFNAAYKDDGGSEASAQGIGLGPDGTVFLANGRDGLRAYSYDGASFTNTAHINDRGRAQGVSVGPDGTVFLANGDRGLIAYVYSGYLNSDIEAFDSAIANKIRIYPNPTNDLINIQTDGTRMFSVVLTSLSGQIIYSMNPSKESHQLDLSSFQKGIYFITISSKDFVTTRKIIKL